MVVGVAGLPQAMVRPRWQPTPPKEAPIEKDWCAVGVTDIEQDFSPSIIHHDEGEGYDETQRHEKISVLASFYGPNARAYAALLRDGIILPQNREQLFHRGLAYYDVGRPTAAPDLIDYVWRKRIDLPMTFVRNVVRYYNILNLKSASGTIHSETASTNWQVTEKTVPQPSTENGK
jgi:hypothetical protein